MKQAVFLLILTLALGCREETSTEVKINVQNASIYDFEDLTVVTPGGTANFGDLTAGSTSAYEVFDLAYRYGYVELTIDTMQLFLQPIDYVGETPLENGDYTYIVGGIEPR